MSMVDIPFPAVQSMGTLADRRAAGKALRKKVARSSHAEWSPDCTRIASADTTGMVHVWDAARGAFVSCIAVMQGSL